MEKVSNGCEVSIATLFISLPKSILAAVSFTPQKASSPDGVGSLPEADAKADPVAGGSGLRKT